MSLVVKLPFGTQSFGQVSLGILREIFSLRDDVRLHPEGNVLNIASIENCGCDKSILDKIIASYNNRYNFNPVSDKCLRLWHLNGSENKICNKQILYTFHETSELTDLEKKLCSLQERVIVSSNYSKGIFAKSNINVDVVNIGFDESISLIERKLFRATHFVLMGKFEKRKHTAKILDLWAKKYGNNPDFKLTCCVTNQFISQEENDRLFLSALDNKQYYNIARLPYLPKNSMVNDLMSSADIDLTGLSGGEGWNLPAFNMTCLGKWSVVLNATAHKDWATEENSILVEPSGEMPSEDGFFFKKGAPFNQGNFFDFSEESFFNACKKAELVAKIKNTNGLILGKEKTYKSTAKELMSYL